ncbi:MAG: flagellar hook-associated protein FlgK [Gammaproteobacteria bacterium]
MADFLSTSVTGLMAFQRAIDATSQNISNVSTPGYSRQRVDLTARPAQMYANGWVGAGVQVNTTARVYDDMIADQVRVASSSFGNLDAYTTLMNRVNDMFSNTTTGLTPSLQKFANAMQDVANNPTNSSARQVLLSEANGLTDRLKSYNTQLDQLSKQVETTITGEVSEVSTLSKGIADLNDQIATAYARSNQPPNDLLDQRDLLLDKLATHIDVTTVKQGDGQINVFVGSGQPLVVGKEASSLVTTTDPYDATKHTIGLKGPGGTPIDITSSITGGTLGGAMAFRSEVLDPTRNTLGRISVALTDTVNAQHGSGIDLSGNMGGDLFSVGSVSVLPHSSNTGTGVPAVTRTGASALTTSDYILQKTAVAAPPATPTDTWTLRNLDTGATVSMTGTGTASDPFKADGLAIVVNSGAQVGDRFEVRPTRDATGGLDVEISDPAKIAAAAPIRTSAASANTGTGTISAGSVFDATDANLRTTSTIQFIDATHYSINGAGSFSYSADQPILVNGASVSISGAPATGDTFTIKDNAGGTGDNRNILALADSLAKPVMDNGTVSLNDSTSRLVGQIGAATRQVTASRDAQQIVQQEASDARDSVSGVNLDEEAANLIKYQQAYQAAAQMIGIAKNLFDTLLAATSRN